MNKEKSNIRKLQDNLMDDLEEIRKDSMPIEKTTKICKHAMVVIRAEHAKAEAKNAKVALLRVGDPTKTRA